jgi:hypothetical protein
MQSVALRRPSDAKALWQEQQELIRMKGTADCCPSARSFPFLTLSCPDRRASCTPSPVSCWSAAATSKKPPSTTTTTPACSSCACSSPATRSRHDACACSCALRRAVRDAMEPARHRPAHAHGADGQQAGPLPERPAVPLEKRLLPLDIRAIVSNHRDFYQLAASYNVPFHHIPVTAAPRPRPKRGSSRSSSRKRPSWWCWRATCRS